MFIFCNNYFLCNNNSLFFIPIKLLIMIFFCFFSGNCHGNMSIDMLYNKFTLRKLISHDLLLLTLSSDKSITTVCQIPLSSATSNSKPCRIIKLFTAVVIFYLCVCFCAWMHKASKKMQKHLSTLDLLSVNFFFLSFCTIVINC